MHGLAQRRFVQRIAARRVGTRARQHRLRQQARWLAGLLACARGSERLGARARTRVYVARIWCARPGILCRHAARAAPGRARGRPGGTHPTENAPCPRACSIAPSDGAASDHTANVRATSCMLALFLKAQLGQTTRRGRRSRARRRARSAGHVRRPSCGTDTPAQHLRRRAGGTPANPGCQSSGGDASRTTGPIFFCDAPSTIFGLRWRLCLSA